MRLHSEAQCREHLLTRPSRLIVASGAHGGAERGHKAGDRPASAAGLAAARARARGLGNASLRAFWAWAVGGWYTEPFDTQRRYSEFTRCAGILAPTSSRKPKTLTLPYLLKPGDLKLAERGRAATGGRTSRRRRDAKKADAPETPGTRPLWCWGVTGIGEWSKTKNQTFSKSII